jgi:type III secretion protein R
MVMALSMVMSLVVMQPVLSKTKDALAEISVAELSRGTLGAILKRAEPIMAPWHAFLLEHSGERELETFRRLAQGPSLKPEQTAILGNDGHLATALGAFVLSEIKKGFLISFLLLIPFFALDLIVGNVLVALGLTMMSPSTVSLPLKLLLFVSSDGWLLLARSLISAYR